MAKVDVSKIEGYDTMSAEEKVKALEAFEIEGEKPDYTGYIKKETFDKTASELAAAKKQLKDRLSEEEQAKIKEAEERAELESKYEKLLHENEVAKSKAKLVSLGYEEALADETAEAMADGDLEKVMANQKKHLEAFEKKLRAEVLKDVPPPTGDGDDKPMTLEAFRAMSPEARLAFSESHPEEYHKLYGGN